MTAVLGRRSPVSLPTVFKPVAHLGGGEPGGLGQVPLLGRIWVRVLQVPLSQQFLDLFLSEEEENAVHYFMTSQLGCRQVLALTNFAGGGAIIIAINTSGKYVLGLQQLV